MTPDQKGEIYKLRQRGLGYKAIANTLLLTVDAVKGIANGTTYVTQRK